MNTNKLELPNNDILNLLNLNKVQRSEMKRFFKEENERPGGPKEGSFEEIMCDILNPASYSIDGYGDANFVKQLINIEKPDAIFLITDPRYFMWLFQIENEIRRKMPIVYLNIWDDYPAPMYNRSYYESCDALLAIFASCNK